MNVKTMTVDELETCYISGKVITQDDAIIWREIDARLRSEEEAREWGKRYPASVGGGDGNQLLAAMDAARKE